MEENKEVYEEYKGWEIMISSYDPLEKDDGTKIDIEWITIKKNIKGIPHCFRPLNKSSLEDRKKIIKCLKEAVNEKEREINDLTTKD